MFLTASLPALPEAAGEEFAMIAAILAILLTALQALAAPAPMPAPATTALPAARGEYLLLKMAEQGIPRERAEALLNDARLQVFPPRVVQARDVDWDKITAGLVAPASVRSGVEFVSKHETALNSAEQRYGVDRETLVGLLRMESNFGRITGNYVVFNVFYTLLVQREEERRWKFAADNLAALAVYCQRRGGDCFDVKGSYGGALGAAQFLPFSIIQWGADGNGDGTVNPYQMEDAIHSAANFLVAHGWHQDSTAALGKYYGQTIGYPHAVESYAEALRAATGRERPALATPPAATAPPAAEAAN